MAITRYEDDLYQWAVDTARAIEERRFDEIDIEHVADEVLAVGRSDLRALRSQMRRVMLHLLKIRYQPNKYTPSWDHTVNDARVQIRILLQESPSFRRLVQGEMGNAWLLARNGAMRETGLAEEMFPVECPFTVEEVIGPLE